MRYVKFIVIILIVAIAFFAGFFISRIGFTGLVVKNYENYSWTRAICNSDNQCIDVVVHCENGNVKSLEPVSGVVYHNASWADPRNESVFCE